MAPKPSSRKGKEKVGESSNKRAVGIETLEFDAVRFCSHAAQERFNLSMLTRNPIEEKVFEGLRTDEFHIEDAIEHYGWEFFCGRAVWPYSTSLVREFYTNAWAALQQSRELSSVFVRGVNVPITSTCINSLLRTRQMLSPAITIDDDDVLRELCPPGAQWKGTTLPSKDMLRIPKAWLHFVGSRLMPVSHFNMVTRPRVHLVYKIYKLLPVDVGSVILGEIIMCTKGVGGLFFPSLITELCRQSGIRVPARECKSIKLIIDHHVIDGLQAKKMTDEISHAEGTNVDSSQLGSTTMESAIRELRAGQQQLVQGQVRLERGVRHLHREVSSFTTLLRAMATHSGVEIPAVQSSSSEEDDAEEDADAADDDDDDDE